MFPSTDRQRLLDQIRALPDALAAAVTTLSEPQLDAHTPADPWTIRQVTHHVADSHLNAFVRIKLMLTEEHPTLKPYDQDAWAELADTVTMPVSASLEVLRGLHARWVALFESLPETAWTRSAYHPEQGTVTVGGMLATYAQHGADHLAQIARIRAALPPP
jgi:hypothetical protein